MQLRGVGVANGADGEERSSVLCRDDDPKGDYAAIFPGQTLSERINSECRVSMLRKTNHLKMH